MYIQTRGIKAANKTSGVMCRGGISLIREYAPSEADMSSKQPALQKLFFSPGGKHRESPATSEPTLISTSFCAVYTVTLHVMAL